MLVKRLDLGPAAEPRVDGVRRGESLTAHNSALLSFGRRSRQALDVVRRVQLAEFVALGWAAPPCTPFQRAAERPRFSRKAAMTPGFGPLPFHEATSQALQALEPGLWSWFASDGYSEKYADSVKLELLRSTYRLPRESHQKLYAIADEVASAFGIGAPLTVYQAQEEHALNAGLVFVPDEVHLVLHGPVVQTLNDHELRALFGHELAHHKLWTEAGGKFRIADALMEHAAGHVGGAPSYVQSALRHRRWTEIYADRGALVASGDITVAVACLVKMSTGLRDVDAQAYLAQAEEAIRASGAGRDGTHPEAFVRAFALKAWHDGEPDSEVRRWVEGVAEIDALDLVQQRELTQATEDVIQQILRPSWMQTEATLTHARRFFPEFALVETATPVPTFAEAAASIAEYISYLLLDFGVADPDIEEMSLPQAAYVAEQIGVEAAFAKVARKELRLSATAYGELEARGRKLAHSMTEENSP